MPEASQLLQAEWCLAPHFVLILSLIVVFPFHTFAAEDPLSFRANAVAPIVIPASQDWDGNDGPWSSFTIQVGTPIQDVKIFISTAATQTWVVVPEGCTSSDPPNCSMLRGGEFLLNQSTTWVRNIANVSSNIYYLGLESTLGYEGAGEYGFDKITLGWQGSGGPTLANQTIAGIATKDFYLGLFGLTPRPSNFTNFDDPIPSYLQNLRNQSLIPSTSWSYTAGNQYRLNQVLGSLVLGGYDASKFILGNVTFSFNEEDARDLTVLIEGITTSNASTTASLLPTPISAFIDSTIPYIWLPTDACALFEAVFGLSYDNQTELYLLNNSQHTALLSQNPSVTFKLSNLTAGLNVNITLPYAAFDLTVSYPIVANPTHYFPLKRASNSSQYTLGRTFLQEAYLIADYDRRNFSVSQCKWDANAQQSIIPIYPPSPQNSSTSTSTSSSSPTTSTALPPGGIAGIAIGAFLLVLILALLAFYVKVLKPRRATRRNTAIAQAPDPVLKPELEAQDIRREAHEVDGKGALPVEIESPTPMPVEVEGQGQENKVFEMPAREEVAVEMGEREAAAPELQGRSVRRKKVAGEVC